MTTPVEIYMKLEDATRAIARKSLKDQSDGFITDFKGYRPLLAQKDRQVKTLVSPLA